MNIDLLRARLILQFVMPETVTISVMVDTIVYGFLFILALGESSLALSL